MKAKMTIQRLLCALFVLAMLISCVGMAFAAEENAVQTSSTAFTTKSGSGETIVGDWLWGDVVASRGADTVMSEFSKAGITDVYLLVKGTSGKVAWNTSVSGAVMSGNGDVLGPTCTAAKKYGIRVHAWMMAGHDDHYVTNIDSGAIAWHFRVGNSSSVIQRINLRNKGYLEYTKALVKELVSKYDIAGIHLDTMRYGALYYDWGQEARDELLTNYGITINQYNAATKAMCATAGYQYTMKTGSTAGYNNGASYSYVAYSSSGSYPSGSSFATVLGNSSYGDAYKGARAFYEMRTDSITNYVKAVGQAAGNDKVISVAIMPEPISSTYETCIYGQSIDKLATCTDYITPMLYATQYAKASSWPAEQSKVCAKAGCNVVTGVQAFNETYVSYASDLNAEIPQIMAAAKTMNADSSTGDILGYAFFRAAFMTVAGSSYDGVNKTVDIYMSNQTSSADTKLVLKMQNGMTATAVKSQSGFVSGTSVSISSDKKTVTISRSGNSVLAAYAGAKITLAVTGSPSDTHGIAQLTSYKGSSYSEGKSFCVMMGQKISDGGGSSDGGSDSGTTTPASKDNVLMDFSSGNVGAATSNWTGVRATAAVNTTKGILSGNITGADPSVRMASNLLNRTISAGDVIEMRIRTNVTMCNSSGLQVFFTTDKSTGFGSARVLGNGSIKHKANSYQTIRMTVPKDAAYIGETMTSLRVDMVNTFDSTAPTGTYEIDYIYVGTASGAPARSYCTGNKHLDVETWSNEDGTHFAFCFNCMQTITEACELDHVTSGYTCVGGATFTDGRSLTGGCGYGQASALFFDFTNTSTDVSKYSSSIYGGNNYDTGFWGFNKARNTAPVFDNAAGTMSFTIAATSDDYYATGVSPFIQTTDAGGALANAALKYTPGKTDVMQIRFKLENCAVVSGVNPAVRLYFATEETGSMAGSATRNISTEDLTSGKFITVTIPLYNNEAYAAAKSIVTARVAFPNVRSADGKTGKITIDYIYIGADNGQPVQDHLYFGFRNTETDQERYGTRTYGSNNYDTGSWAYNPARNTKPVFGTNTLSFYIADTTDNYNATGVAPFIQTTDDSAAFANSALFYDPGENDVMQIRFAMKDCAVVDGVNPAVRLYFSSKEDGSFAGSVTRNIAVENLTSQKYFTMTLPLSESKEYLAADIISTIRLAFPNVRSADNARGLITIDYIYIGSVEKSLFVDFENGAADQERYNSFTYDGCNLDLATNWYASATEAKDLKVSDGVLKYTVVAPNHNIYTGKGSGVGPLKYVPSEGDYCQVRFRVDNGTSTSNNNMRFTLYAVDANGVSQGYQRNEFPFANANGKYCILTYKLPDTWTAVEEVSSLRLGWNYISAGATVTVDYVYVGPKADLPAPYHTVTFCAENGTILQTAEVINGGNVTFTGTAPTKAADGTNHYTFSGKWKNDLGETVELTSIKADLKLYPVFTATAHTKQTKNAKAATCTETGYTGDVYCSVCNYKISTGKSIAALGHSYTYNVSTKPTTSAAGKLTGTCSRCSATTTVNLPKLSTTDYTYKVTKAATCTATGTGRYTWKTTTYGSFYFDVSIAATGHKLSYTNKNNGTHTVTCANCTHSVTELHKFTSGACVCGAKETAATSLLFHFAGDQTAKVRYNNAAYNYRNYDLATNGYWITYANGNSSDYTINNSTGLMRLSVTDATAGSGTNMMYGPTIKTAKANGSADDIMNVLNYKPNGAQVMQIRFSLDNCVFNAGGTSAAVPAVEFQYGYEKSGKTATVYATNVNYTFANGKYIIITLPLDDTFNNADRIGYVAVRFKHIKQASTAGGAVNIDYLYVGSESTMPTKHSYKSVVTAPTCTEKGYTTHTCTNCGYSYVDTYVNALGHSYTYKVATKPTTSAAGKLTGTCSRCSATTTVNLPKLSTTDYTYKVTKAATCAATGTGRYTWKTTTYGSFYFDVTIAKTSHSYKSVVTAPTCTEQGYTTHTCASCGNSYKDTYTKATGHSFNAWEYTLLPTCEAKGEQWRDCKNCDHTETREVAALGHDYKAVVTEPTCTEQGYTTHTCAACGNSYVDTYVAAHGHKYESRIQGNVEIFTCIYCGHSYEIVIETEPQPTEPTPTEPEPTEPEVTEPVNPDAKNGIYLEDGLYYYYVNDQIQYAAGLVCVDGAYYYIRSGGYAAIGEYWCTNTNGITEEGFYIFGEDGKMLLNDTSKNGIYYEGGKYYYYVGGEIGFGAGLVYVDGYYYYIRSGGYATIGEYWVSNTNGLMEEGMYTFGSDGRMIIATELKNGIVLENGLYYYYIDGEIQYAAGLVFVDGAYYYIRSGGYAATGSYWVTNTNGITEEGFYIFGEDGKMILNDTSKNGIYLEGGLYYYYKDGNIGFGAGLVQVDGDYYYIRSGGYAAIGEYYVSITNGLLPEGTYTFGNDGKMIR